MSHLTHKECKEIDELYIKDPDIHPICNSWEEIQQTLAYAIEQVLAYTNSKNKNIITDKDMQDSIEFMQKVIAAKEHRDLNGDSIQKQLDLIVGQNKEILSAVKKSIKVRVEFAFEKPVKFDLEFSEKYYKAFKNAVESYLKQIGKSTNCLTVKTEGEVPQTSSKNSFFLCFKIKSHSDDVDLNDYDCINSSKYGKDLWIFLKGELERCLLYTSPSPRDATLSRMPSSA